jgi:hypothetical protein
VHVRVRRPGTRVAGRSRYFVGGQDRGTPTSRAAGSALDETGLPVRVWCEAETTVTAGRVGVAVFVGLDATDESGRGRRVALILVGRRLLGGVPVTDTAEVQLDPSNGRTIRHLLLEPGTWQIRAVVTDVATGAVGSALHTFDVPGQAEAR